MSTSLISVQMKQIIHMSQATYQWKNKEVEQTKIATTISCSL